MRFMSFSRAVEFTLGWEGGFSNDPADPGNWTGGEVGKGALVGTKFGISAASYPDVDLANLTRDDAKAIYRRDYWEALGLDADQYGPDYQVVAFDSAVQHGVGTVRAWMRRFPTVEGLLVHRLGFYLQLRNFDRYGRGWVRRLHSLMAMVLHSKNELAEVTSFWLVCSPTLTIPMPYVKASVVGTKLYVRMYQYDSEYDDNLN